MPRRKKPSSWSGYAKKGSKKKTPTRRRKPAAKATKKRKAVRKNTQPAEVKLVLEALPENTVSRPDVPTSFAVPVKERGRARF